MIPPARKILVFGILFVPLFAVSLTVYLWLLPSYEPLALGSANLVTKRLDPATDIRVRETGGWEAFVFTPAEGRQRLRTWSDTTAHLVFLSLASLPALLLATPAPWLRRLKLLLISMPLLFVGHVASVIILTRGVQCLQEAPGTFWCLWALRIAYTSGQLLAAALWVLLTWRSWFSEGTGTTVDATPPRGA